MQRLSRLSDSLRDNFDGDFLAFVGEAGLGAPLHSENPYAFKLYAIERALEAGYTQILWLDSSCFAIAPVQPVFNHILQRGYIIQESGHMIGTWCNDTALKYFGMSRDEAMGIRMYGNAGLLGLDFTRSGCVDFFKQWQQSMINGCFIGSWNNDNKTESQDDRCRGHRHDMVCGSIIANRLGMELQSGEQWLQYAGLYDRVINDSIIFKAQG